MGLERFSKILGESRNIKKALDKRMENIIARQQKDDIKTYKISNNIINDMFVKGKASLN